MSRLRSTSVFLPMRTSFMLEMATTKIERENTATGYILESVIRFTDDMIVQSYLPVHK